MEMHIIVRRVWRGNEKACQNKGVMKGFEHFMWRWCVIGSGTGHEVVCSQWKWTVEESCLFAFHFMGLVMQMTQQYRTWIASTYGYGICHLYVIIYIVWQENPYVSAPLKRVQMPANVSFPKCICHSSTAWHLSSLGHHAYRIIFDCLEVAHVSRGQLIYPKMPAVVVSFNRSCTLHTLP